MHNSYKILSIDIGGTSVKVATLDSNGTIIDAYTKLPTPSPSTPDAILETIRELVKDFTFDKISAGFPGYVKNGVVITAPNLAEGAWANIDFAGKLTAAFDKPALVINDADMHGLGLVSGKGFEMVVTLGTGFGTAFFNNGVLLPHLEMAHHPIKKGKTYDEYLGSNALEKCGLEKWTKRVEYVLSVLKTVFNYDALYLGGGNAKKLKCELDSNIKIVQNIDGIDGGSKLWQQQEDGQ